MTRRLAIAVLAIGIAAVPVAALASAPRVYNGSSLDAVPLWMGFVQTKIESGGIYGCGGTAISPNVVLTAAHCVVDEAQNAYVAPEQVGVAFGQNDPWGAVAGQTLQLNPVVSYYTPASYGKLASGGLLYDVALLQLRDPAPGTLDVLPSTQSRLIASGAGAGVLGWGQTIDGSDQSLPRALQYGAFAIQPYNRCSRRFAGYDAASMLCAWGNLSQAVCHGDSGGPLLVADPSGALFQVGVASTAVPCDPQNPSVFTNVATGSLASFVTRYAAELQQAADNAAPPAQTPVAPAAMPSLSLGVARSTARAYAQRHWKFSVYSTRCSRKSAAQFTCRVEGRKRGRRGWVGRMTITATTRGIEVTA
jgi:secreted trypsin-like serine protease